MAATSAQQDYVNQQEIERQKQEYVKRGLHNVVSEPYPKQSSTWPREGRQIVAQYNDEAILVYQAYGYDIGKYVVANGKFEGCPAWSPSRMTWIKPNFLWMMYRSGWGTKRGQEITVGLWLKRDFFESLLSKTVHSKFDSTAYENEHEFHKATTQAKQSGEYVMLQWDPDHHPNGTKHALRRDIQLGLKNVPAWGDGSAFLAVVDMTSFVESQYQAATMQVWDSLITPCEKVYPVSQELAKHLGMI